MFGMNKDVNEMKNWNNVPRQNEGMGRMSYEAQERMGKQAGIDSLGQLQGERPAVTLGIQSCFNISDPYSDNLVGEDRRKDRLLVVPSHGQESVLLRRPHSSHSSTSHEGLPDRTATEGGARRETGAVAGNKGSTTEASFSEMLKKTSSSSSSSCSMKKVAAEASSDATAEGNKGGGKKKGKKGRQMDPALLGFKVASNRILMGEIHRADDF
jgi:hypothetical protein